MLLIQNKKEQRWLWHAMDHCTGKAVAYVLGQRQDKGFLQWKTLLEPCGITRYYTDCWGASTRHFNPDEHTPGKRNTPKIERKPLTVRPRIKRLPRKTIGFSQWCTETPIFYTLACRICIDCLKLKGRDVTIDSAREPWVVCVDYLT